MYILFSVLILIICILLVLIVLVQNSKGGGLSATFGGGQGQAMGGVKKTADFLEKATWTLAVALLVFSLLATMTIPREEGRNESVIEEQIQNAADPTQTPTFPTTPNQGGQENENQNDFPIE